MIVFVHIEVGILCHYAKGWRDVIWRLEISRIYLIIYRFYLFIFL